MVAAPGRVSCIVHDKCAKNCPAFVGASRTGREG